MAEEWIALREFGRRYRVSLPAVQKAIAMGRIPPDLVRQDRRGRNVGLKAVAAAMAWNANTDPAEAAKNGKSALHIPRESGASDMAGQGVAPALGPEMELAMSAAKEPAAGQSAAGTPGSYKDADGYNVARTAEKWLDKQLKEITLRKLYGELIPVKEVELANARLWKAIANQLLGVADRVCTQLAYEKDPAQIHAMLTTELKKVMHGLCDDASIEYSGGVSERLEVGM